MEIVVIGGGIAGLAFALALHQRGIACRVFESARQVKELGVGITLLPHGMRELTALGLQDRLRAVAIENQESVFFNRHGQLVYREPRGRFAGYDYPELGIHRGKLHRVLLEAAIERLGAERIVNDRQCVAVDGDWVSSEVTWNLDQAHKMIGMQSDGTTNVITVPVSYSKRVDGSDPANNWWWYSYETAVGWIINTTVQRFRPDRRNP